MCLGVGCSDRVLEIGRGVSGWECSDGVLEIGRGCVWVGCSDWGVGDREGVCLGGV